MGNPPRTRTAHLWRRLFSPVNGAAIDYLSSRHLGALIESSDPLAADGGLGARGGFLCFRPARLRCRSHTTLTMLGSSVVKFLQRGFESLGRHAPDRQLAADWRLRSDTGA